MKKLLFIALLFGTLVSCKETTYEETKVSNNEKTILQDSLKLPGYYLFSDKSYELYIFDATGKLQNKVKYYNGDESTIPSGVVLTVMVLGFFAGFITGLPIGLPK